VLSLLQPSTGGRSLSSRNMRLVPVVVLCIGLTAATVTILCNPNLIQDSRSLKRVSEVVLQMPDLYLASLETHPLRTKCFTGLILFAIADATAQLLTTGGALRARRLACFAFWGAAIGAPLFHLWYAFLARFFRNQLSYSIWFGAIVMSVCDQLLFMPVFVALYYLYNALTTGGTYVEAYIKVRTKHRMVYSPTICYMYFFFLLHVDSPLPILRSGLDDFSWFSVASGALVSSAEIVGILDTC
jgi:hypothetical protein